MVYHFLNGQCRNILTIMLLALSYGLMHLSLTFFLSPWVGQQPSKLKNEKYILWWPKIGCTATKSCWNMFCGAPCWRTYVNVMMKWRDNHKAPLDCLLLLAPYVVTITRVLSFIWTLWQICNDAALCPSKITSCLLGGNLEDN